MNNVCGGSMNDKTSAELYSIFGKLAQNSHQKSSRRRNGIYKVNANTRASIYMAQMNKAIEAFANKVAQIGMMTCTKCGQPWHSVDICQIGGAGPSN